MSTDYSFGIAAGFEVSVKLIIRNWGRTFPEKSHMEERFDPKSGKKLASEKVVDREEGLYFILGGKEVRFDEPQEVIEALGEELEADVQLVDDSPHDLSDEDFVLISPRIKCRDPSAFDLEYGRVTAAGGFLIEDLARELPKFKKLEAFLKKHRLRPGKPMVRITGGYR